MHVTIYDIAKKANVSIATVSRVLNDQPRVADETRARVLAVAAELGYQPHTFAQSLARRQSNLVSVVVPAMSSYFFLEVLRGIQDSLADSGFDIIVHLAKTPKDAVLQFDRALRRGRSAGVLVVSTAVLSAIGDRLARARQAIVLVDCRHQDFDCISVDNVSGGYRATKHLIELGCTRIALAMASEDAPPATDRRAGYRKALEEHGIAYDEQLVASVGGVEDGFSESSGYESMKRILDSGVRPDGVFATSDVQALGVLRAAEEAGLLIPDHLRLVGFDDIPLLQYAGISTMAQPMYELGSVAALRLLERLDNRDLEPVQHVQAPTLVVRATSDARVSDAVGIGIEETN